MKKILSFGGGINSTAMLIELVKSGKAPDHVIFADTGGEFPETYKHIGTMQSWLAGFGVKIEVCGEKKTLEADCLDRETLPSKAFGFGSCSEHFKIRPQRRWLKSQGIKNPLWLVGIHAGEAMRALRVHNQRQDVEFPLIMWKWGQKECVERIEREGIKVPRKSACFFCPSSKKKEVFQIAKTHPELLQRAIEMEDTAKEGGRLDTVKGLGRSWSWRALIEADKEQLKLFDDTAAPVCDACVDW